MMTKCNMVSWMGSWHSIRVLGKNEGNLNKVWALANNNAWVLVH